LNSTDIATRTPETSTTYHSRTCGMADAWLSKRERRIPRKVRLQLEYIW